MRQDKKLGTSVKSMVHKQSWHLEQEKWLWITMMMIGLSPLGVVTVVWGNI